MNRRTAVGRAAVATTVVLALMAGCGSSHSGPGSLAGHGNPRLTVVARLKVPSAGVVLPTRDRLWVISGGSRVATQVDPATNKVVKVVRLPHPAGTATLAHGSLWLASYYSNALMEVDATTGTVLRSLERSPRLPIDGPVGIVATGHVLWTVNHHAGRLLRIDARTGTLISSTSLPGQAAGAPILASGSLWVPLAYDGLVAQIDLATGKIVGKPLPVDTGLCDWGSLVGTSIWYTSEQDTGDGFRCLNGTSRLDTGSGTVTRLDSGDGRSLYTFTRYDGSLWATDVTRSVYQVDESTGGLTRVMTMPGKPDANHVYTAFGSMWMTRSGRGELLRLEMR